jgi:hypothetical protein
MCPMCVSVVTEVFVGVVSTGRIAAFVVSKSRSRGRQQKPAKMHRATYFLQYANHLSLGIQYWPIECCEQR